jgi:hypothetical protein
LLLMVSISMMLLLLVGILISLELLWRRIWRVAAVWVVALVILTLRRGAIAILLVLLVRVVGRCLVALSKSKLAF